MTPKVVLHFENVLFLISSIAMFLVFIPSFLDGLGARTRTSFSKSMGERCPMAECSLFLLYTFFNASSV